MFKMCVADLVQDLRRLLSVLRCRLWLPRLKVQENDCRFSCSFCVDENVAMDLLLLGIT